jgi:Caenorhabditis protein of unknown function, DUF268
VTIAEDAMELDVAVHHTPNCGHVQGLVQKPSRWEDLKVFKSLRQKQSHFTGIYPNTLIKSLLGLPTYFKNLRTYSKLNDLPEFRFTLKDAFPILTDMRAVAGAAGGHYFHQDLWAARKIFKQHPHNHFDIGSRMDGFVAHLLVFMPVTVVDIRPLESNITGLTFLQDDASELANVPNDSVVSLSTLHVAEHFGLGRYTDPIDPHACFRFMSSLQRVLAPGGRLYFSVPVGRERVEFNAHRVFAPRTILSRFDKLQLVSFSFVGDDGCLYEDTDPPDMPESEMACGLFEFTKSTV